MENHVRFESISKRFSGVQALKDISFQADGGEICAILGENGAGKSTLLKVLSGVIKPDSGNCYINDTKLQNMNALEAIGAGISIIYQERQLVKELSVTENVFMSSLPKNKIGIIDFKKAHEETRKIIEKFKLPIQPQEKVENLSVAYQQMVEIMKACRRDSRVIAFDEPTASLSDAEIETLFSIIRQLKKEGKVILYVSHRMEELMQLTDKIVIMKDGCLVKEVRTGQTEIPELIRSMVGREISDLYGNRINSVIQEQIVLEVRNLSNMNFKGVSFKLHKGEILGFAGLVGAGRSEVMRAVFGADPYDEGEILVEGIKTDIRSPKDGIHAGIGLCPEDRKEQGLVLGRTIRENISISMLKSMARKGVIEKGRERKVAENAIKKYGIKTDSMEKIVMELSGGNQQKVILGRWLSSPLKVLILDEPTKGIDVGAKAEIYQMIYRLAEDGFGIIFISSELPEVIHVCDRVVVMHSGRITGQLLKEELTEENVLSLAMNQEE